MSAVAYARFWAKVKPWGFGAKIWQLETMRRLVLHLAAQEPLVLAAPEQEGTPHARQSA
jgi:hypothetical protein